MKTLTLHEILSSQDGGERLATRICDKIIEDKYNPLEDLLTALIVDYFRGNDLDKEIHTEELLSRMKIDLDYAVNQLKKAAQVVENHIGNAREQ